MKTKQLSALLVMLFIAISALAQNKLYFVENVTDNGEPVGHADLWSISPTEGGSIYMLYTNNNKPITDAQLNIKLEKQDENGAWADFDLLTVETEKGKNWLLIEVPFADVGVFRVTIQNAAKKNLVVGNLELIYTEEEIIGDEIEIGDEHAKGFTITFCDSVTEDGTALKPGKEFKRSKGRANVKVLVANPDGLLVPGFTLKITKTGGEPEEIALECDESWVFFYYPYEFTEAGTYTVALLSKSGKLINFEMITIK